ncbi:MAG: phosphoglucosamine mutase, partial [Pseudomonadales bacterium]
AATDKLEGGIVGTVMTNFGLERALTEARIPFARAQVGDRYVLEMLKRKAWEVGGESSGHIICLDLTTTGDAIVAALQVLIAVVESGQSLHELKKGMIKLPQVMVNVVVDRPGDVAQLAGVTQAVKALTKLLEGRGRVLVRPSGTEPVVRVMVEGEDEAEVTAIAEELAELVKREATA